MPPWAEGRRVRAYTDPKGRQWYYDHDAAMRAIAWIERFCRHSVGEWYGQKLTLLPWQKRIVRKLFGWKRPDGTRRYRKLWCEVPRKNGKSTFVAGIAKLLAWADGEPGAQVFCIAGNEEQARLVFAECSKMAQLEPAFEGKLEVLKDAIFSPASLSVIKVLTGRATGKHGLNPHGVIGDEVHEWSHREQYDAMQTAVGARRQPMQVYITTAGANRRSLCWELHRTAVAIQKGIFDLPDWLVVIYAADPEDDWTAESTWKKANPSYGVTIKPDFLRAECEAARANPANENAFKRLYLNLWTDALTRWVPSEQWNGCRAEQSLEDFAGETCVLGLDLAREHDLSALAYWFLPTAARPWWSLFVRFWCPQDDINERSREQRVPYDIWTRDGWISVTPGNVTDFGYIERDIRGAFEKFDVMQLGYDRTFAGEIVNSLHADGYPLIKVPQTCLYLGNATSEMARKIRGAEMRHNGNPVMNWNMENVVIYTDSSGNQKPDKGRSEEKIDGVAAAVTGLAVALAEEPPRELDINRRPAEVW